MKTGQAYITRCKCFRVVRKDDGELRLEKVGYQGEWFDCDNLRSPTSMAAARRAARFWATGSSR